MTARNSIARTACAALPAMMAAIFVLNFLASPALGQGIFDGLNPLVESSSSNKDAVKLSADFKLNKGTSEGMLNVHARLAPGWHIYSVTQPPKGPIRTVITVDKSADFQVKGEFEPDRPPTPRMTKDWKVPAEEHEGEVTWSAPISLADGVVPEDVAITVHMVGQVCDANSCNWVDDKPIPAKFAGYIEDSMAAASEASPPTPQTDETGEASSNAAESSDANLTYKVASEASSYSFALILPIAFLGGFILNFMPCVLPVIGLKVMSFVQQAGQDRRTAFMLNLWYVLGIVAVFMALATLAVAAGFGWGQQNQSVEFNIVMVSILFVMGLSFLGVWEIPIPGFAGGKAANAAQDKEGPVGAIAKGVITTIVAVPCSGPGLATALAWCAGKPAPLVYAVFGAMSLGMAFPFLVLGANPRLAKLLPKPGPWMDTFKQIMGFVLMGTVVFMFIYISSELIPQTLALLLGLAIACWCIGRVPSYAERAEKLRAWIVGVGVSSLIGGAVFLWPENPHKLPWQDFSISRVEELAKQDKTVMVDFTADWCLTCKYLERTVLNTKDVKDFVTANNVETLMADWTDRDEETAKILEALGSSKQIPVLAIFPAGKPNEPIVLIGGYTQGKLLDKLKQAGPSKTARAKAPVAEVAQVAK